MKDSPYSQPPSSRATGLGPMPPLEDGSFNAHVERYLGSRLPSRLADECALGPLPAEAREIILRTLSLMKQGAFPVTDINSQMIWLLATATPAMLPSAWGGRIPPLTVQGRHRKLDAYVNRHVRWSGENRPIFIDLGCGFPPLTTVDTARSLPEWRVYGIDRSFASYTLFDREGDYACFDGHGKFMYFQPLKKPLHDNPASARHRFEALFADLSTDIPAAEDDAHWSVQKNANRLVHNHVRDFEAPNLTFIEAELEDLQLSPAHVIRCMNVLLYFDNDVRQRLRASMEVLLDDGGLLISGFNHPFGAYARYLVRKKEASGVRAIEFAFSPDNLRPLGIGPWVTIRGTDEDADLLAELSGAIRSDRRFWGEFNATVDVLQEQYDICRRDGDGFIRFTETARCTPPLAMHAKATALWDQLEAEGYTDGAVEALVRAGYQAWKNPVGDIAVLPRRG